jgi:anti-anti-sigma factor
MPRAEHLHLERDGPLLVVSAIGEWGGLAGDRLPCEVDELLGEMEQRGITRVIVDLSEAPFFGSPLLAALVRIRKQLASISGEMVLCNVSDMGREVLHVCHFEQLWVTCNSRREARAALLSEDREVTAT